MSVSLLVARVDTCTLHRQSSYTRMAHQHVPGPEGMLHVPAQSQEHEGVQETAVTPVEQDLSFIWAVDFNIDFSVEPDKTFIWSVNCWWLRRKQSQKAKDRHEQQHYSTQVVAQAIQPVVKTLEPSKHWTLVLLHTSLHTAQHVVMLMVKILLFWSGVRELK